MTIPRILQENTSLAFLGETAWPPALLSEGEAQSLASAPNACGRPNADVLRQRLAVTAAQPVVSWQIDFPEHFTAQEAALYERPFALLSKRANGVWQNPGTNAGLRRSLARVSRFLATPAIAAAPDWRWIEEDFIPDATLLIVARDDDFTHGVLQSHPFTVWWQQQHSTQAPDAIVHSFPFPWPPATALSALTAAQEEKRHAISRAARSGDVDQINTAVLAAYGWPPDANKDELLSVVGALALKRQGR